MKRSDKFNYYNQLVETSLKMSSISLSDKDSETMTCQNCGLLLKQLEERKTRNKELEATNERLAEEIQSLLQQNNLALQSPAGTWRISSSLDAEIDLKKSISGQMNASHSSGDDVTPGCQGINLKALQQDLRVSKKGELLAKEKLSTTKKAFEKLEKDFAKYREESEQRIESLKAEIGILQKHYDLLQSTSVETLSTEQPTFGAKGKDSLSSIETKSQNTVGLSQTADLLKIIDDYSRQNEAKVKELEQLTLKLDKKQSKLRDFKKKHAETESRAAKLKNTLDNVKSFLKLLNTNFIKSMKQQNASLREQILTCEQEFLKEIQGVKNIIGPQLERILESKKKKMATVSQTEVIQVIHNQIANEKGESEMELTLRESSIQNEQLQAKIASQETIIKSLQEEVMHGKETSLKNQNTISSLKANLEKLRTESDKQKQHITNIEALNAQFKEEYRDLTLERDEIRRERDALSSLINQLKSDYALRIQSLQSQLEMSRSQAAEPPVQNAQLLTQNEPDQTQFIDADLQNQSSTDTQKRKTKKVKKVKKYSSRHSQDLQRNDFEDSSSALDQSQISYGQLNQTGVLEEDVSVIVPPAISLVIQPKEQTLHQLQVEQRRQNESRASSSQGSSFDHQYEGGQEEKKEEHQTTTNPMAPIFRPPALQPRPPVGVGRGRGMPQFRPPVGAPGGFRPPIQRRPPVFNLMQNQAPTILQEPTPQQSKEQTIVNEENKGLTSENSSAKQIPAEINKAEQVKSPPVISQVQTNMKPQDKNTEQRVLAPAQEGVKENISIDENQENKKASPQIKEEIKEAAPPTEQAKNQQNPAPASNTTQEMQKSDQNQNQNNAASLLDFRNNRFFGMINGFLTFLTRRKRAYTGRPATAMYYDEKKRRYVIEGEEDSDDDVPPPPPPMKQKTQSNDASSVNNKAQGRREEEGATSAEALARPALTGALANRGRGRGRGAPINRFPQTFGANQLTQSSIVPPTLDIAVSDERLVSPRPDNLVKQQQTPRQQDLKTPRGAIQEENSELYTTTLDVGLNQTQYEQPNNVINESTNEDDLNGNNPFQESRYEDANDESTMFNYQTNVGRKSQLLNSTMVIQPPQGIATDQAREDDWLDRFNQQQDKINNLKYKLSMMQQELRNEREQNEQAIEYFTVLCQDLEFKGMDEVEDLQSDISIYKDQLRNLAQEKAYHEIKLSQMTDALAFSEQDNHNLRNEVNELKLKLVQAEIDYEIQKLNLINNNEELVPEIQEPQGSSLEVEESVVALKQTIFQQQCDLDNLQYRAAILEAEKLSKSLDIRDLQQQVNAMRGQLTHAEANGARLQEDLRRVEEEQKQYGQEQVNKLEREKESIKEMLQKVQSEKERLAEQSRERVNDYESRLKRLENERQRSELDTSRALREKDGVIDSLRNQNLGLNQQVSQAGEEVKWLQAQVRELQSKVAQLQAKRHSESEQTESLLRAQIKQVQEMLQQREAQAELLATKHEEASLELQQMEAIRHKMTENIIYLQNEIRKRDDLLENSSEFGGDFEMIGDEDVDGDDSSLLVGGADGDDYSNRGGAMSLRGTGEDSQRDIINAAGGDQIGAGASSLRQSFQMVKKQQTRRRTLNHALQNQLEETRQQLKSQIEEKLLTQRKLQNVEYTLRKLVEGFIDVNKILDTQHSQLARITGIEQSSTTGILTSEGEQSLALSQQDQQLTQSSDMFFGMTQEQLSSIDASLDQISADESIHTVISKIFALQRGYESELSDLKHRLKMQQMQIEEAENLKFDIEILTDEKGMLEGEIAVMAAQVKDLEAKNAELQRHLSEEKTSHEAQLRSLQEDHRQAIAREREEHNALMNQQRAQTQKQIDEIHETFKSQMLPAVKEKYQAKYQKLQEQLKEVTNSFTEQLEQEKLQRSQSELQQSSLLNQSQLQIDNYSEEVERLKDELKISKLNFEELQNKMAAMIMSKSTNEQLCASQAQEINQLRQELEESKDSQQRQVEKMVADFDEIAQRLKQKADQKKKELKDFKAKMKVVLQQVQEEAAQKWSEEKDLLEKNLQLALEQAQQQQNSKQLDEYLSKEESYKARINELEEMIEAMEREGNERLQEQAFKYEGINQQLQAQQIQDKEDLKKEIEALKLQLEESLKQNLEQQPLQPNEDQQQLINILQEQLSSSQEELRKANQQFEQNLATLQEEVASKQEEIRRRDEEIAQKESELQATIENYTQSMEQLKTQTKEVVMGLKDKIKKEKEKVSQEAAKHQSERKQLEMQIIELRKQHEYHKGEDIKQLESTIESMRATFDELKQSANDKDELIRQAEEKNMQIANELESAKRNLESCIDKLAEILGEDRINSDLDSLLSKMQEVINNYEEDRRSLRVMIEEKERLVELNEQYLSERESLLQDQQSLKQKLEGTGQSTKLEKKVKMLEEERSLMRSDYNLQINSFVQEIDKLKGRLSRYEEVIDAPAEEEEEVKVTKEEEHSFGRKPDGESTTMNPPSFFDQSKIPKQTDQTTDKGQQQQPAAQKSGIFNSIASFFLTDSQLENDQDQE